MKAVLQRVKKASVLVEGRDLREIGEGFVILLGVTHADDEKKADVLASKILNLRIFPDGEGKMNRSLKDIGGDVLVVSNFTLYADCAKGRRPSFLEAALPDHAKRLYQHFLTFFERECPGKTAFGEFGAHMEVDISNFGPVTVILDTDEIMK